MPEVLKWKIRKTNIRGNNASSQHKVNKPNLKEDREWGEKKELVHICPNSTELGPIKRKPPMFLMIMHGMHLTFFANQWVTCRQSHTDTHNSIVYTSY